MRFERKFPAYGLRIQRTRIVQNTRVREKSSSILLIALAGRVTRIHHRAAASSRNNSATWLQLRAVLISKSCSMASSLKLIAFQRHSLELAGRVDVCAVVSANLLSAAAFDLLLSPVYGCKIVFWRLETPIHTPSSTIQLQQLRV
jgi:hypothetical protein